MFSTGVRVGCDTFESTAATIEFDASATTMTLSTTVIAASLTTSTTSLTTYVSDDIRDVSDDIHDLSDDIHDVSDDIHDLSDDIRDLSDDIRDVSDDIHDLSDDIHDLSDDIHEVTVVSRLRRRGVHTHHHYRHPRVGEVSRLAVAYGFHVHGDIVWNGRCIVAETFIHTRLEVVLVFVHQLNHTENTRSFKAHQNLYTAHVGNMRLNSRHIYNSTTIVQIAFFM